MFIYLFIYFQRRTEDRENAEFPGYFHIDRLGASRPYWWEIRLRQLKIRAGPFE